MPKRSESLLEKLKLGQQGWNEVLSRNAQRLNDILLKVDGILDVDITGLATGDVLWWSVSSQKFENVNKAYAISAASVSSASSISSESSESSVTISSLSSESSENIVSNSSSSVSSESSESSFSCGNMASDQTSGETFSASDYYSTYVAANAFDDNNSTSWIVDVPGGWQWIEVEFAISKSIMQLRVRSANIGWENTPTDLQLKASGNGNFVGEENLVFQTSGLTWTQNEWKTFQFQTLVDVDYYRLYVNGSLSQYNIAEIEMMECNDYSVSSESSESSSSESSNSSSASGLLRQHITADADDGDAVGPPSSAFRPSNDYAGLGDVSSLSLRGFFRFTNVNLAKDEYINSAVLRFCAQASNSSSPVNTDIKIEADDDPAAPSSYANLTGRSLGSGVAWDGVSGFTAGSFYNTVDFKTILQTHVRRAGWAAGQALTVHILNGGSGDTKWRAVKSHELTTTECAELIVTYGSSESSESSETISSSSSSSESSESIPSGEFTKLIAAGVHDGDAQTGSGTYISTNDYASFGNQSGLSMRAFFRFENVDIGQFTTISQALIKCNAYSSTGNNPVNTKIYIEDADNPTAPVQSENIKTRPLGTAVNWNNEQDWTGGNTYYSDDFSTILEQHLQRSGWVSGNALHVHIINNASGNNCYRWLKSYDLDVDLCAQLRVNYGDPSESSESSESSYSSESSESSESL